MRLENFWDDEMLSSFQGATGHKLDLKFYIVCSLNVIGWLEKSSIYVAPKRMKVARQCWGQKGLSKEKGLLLLL